MEKELQENMTIKMYPRQKKNLIGFKNDANIPWPQFMQLLMDTYEESLEEDNGK